MARRRYAYHQSTIWQRQICQSCPPPVFECPANARLLKILDVSFQLQALGMLRQSVWEPRMFSGGTSWTWWEWLLLSSGIPCQIITRYGTVGVGTQLVSVSKFWMLAVQHLAFLRNMCIYQFTQCDCLVPEDPILHQRQYPWGLLRIRPWYRQSHDLLLPTDLNWGEIVREFLGNYIFVRHVRRCKGRNLVGFQESWFVDIKVEGWHWLKVGVTVTRATATVKPTLNFPKTRALIGPTLIASLH